MTVATAPSPLAPPAAHRPSPDTLWGLDARALHDAWWRARGVQCVRRGEAWEPERGAELFLLLEPDTLVLFDPAPLAERLTWNGAVLTRLRVVDEHEPPYGERVVIDDEGRVERIARRYRAQRRTSARAVLTTRGRFAARWSAAATRRDGWRALRRRASWAQLDHARVVGSVCRAPSRDAAVGHGQAAPDHGTMTCELVNRWADPSEAIGDIEEVRPGVWVRSGVTLPEDVVAIGPLWLGAAPRDGVRCLVGPDWIGDDRETTPAPLRAIHEIAPPETVASVSGPPPRSAYTLLKRAVDVAISGVALLTLLPVFAFMAACIVLEDGRPVFFSHRRQGRGGRPFRCIKFRTMHRNAEQIARELDAYNICDGPQVYIRDDPRVTRVGRVLRSAHVDELPQLWNVLVGDMSLVGPRPSPDDENQYCPAWRDARLSVRPGISGLWQLERTRRPGEDFQEWIRYDLEYVHNAGFWLDLKIMWRTAKLMILGRS